MDIKIAICDDESAQCNHLKHLLHNWNHSVTVNSFSSAEAFLFQYNDDKSYDILILDIEIGDMNGVDLAKLIRRNNKTVQIIFVTGYMEYLAEGYEVEALHYLIKPVTESKLFGVLDRAVQKIKSNEQMLMLDLRDERIRVPLYEISYLEVRRNYVTVHADNEYTVKTTLNELEKELSDTFYRIGRSYIINLKYIRRVSHTEIYLTDGSVIPLPRGQYDAIHRMMINKL